MTAREDMDAVLDALVGFAKEMLTARGAFYPFGAEMATDGRVQMVTADIDDASPAPEAVVAALYHRLGGDVSAGVIRCAGTCVDVRLDDGSSDAIRVDVEHPAADPVRVFLPYRVEAPGRIVFGGLVAEPGRRSVFAPGEGRE